MNITKVSANVKEVVYQNNIMLVSYDRVVALLNKSNQTFLRTEDHYSKGTTRHISTFFNRHKVNEAKVSNISQEFLDSFLSEKISSEFLKKNRIKTLATKKMKNAIVNEVKNVLFSV